MKCHICDKELSDKEVSWNKDLSAFEPCSTCLDIAFDAAFSDGFSRPDDDDKFVIVEDEDNASYESAMNTMYSYFKRGDDDD